MKEPQILCIYGNIVPLSEVILYLCLREFRTLVPRESRDSLIYLHISYTPSCGVLEETYQPYMAKRCNPSVVWLAELVRLSYAWYNVPMDSMVTSPQAK